jgi:hypothetical protein
MLLRCRSPVKYTAVDPFRFLREFLAKIAFFFTSCPSSERARAAHCSPAKSRFQSNNSEKWKGASGGARAARRAAALAPYAVRRNCDGLTPNLVWNLTEKCEGFRNPHLAAITATDAGVVRSNADARRNRSSST